MNEPKWDRRQEDKKNRDALRKALEKLEGKLDSGLERLGDEINDINEYLRGGPNNQDPLGTRVHLVESGLTELRVIVRGDALGRGSLIEMAKATSELAREAKKEAESARRTAEGRVEFQTTTRGQNVSIVLGILSLVGVIAVGLLGNWDRVEKLMGKRETAQQYLARMNKEIAEMKKTRGPEVEKKLKELERAARHARLDE